MRKSESFLATFGPKLWSITLFVHARYGAMKVLCTGLVECGGVLGSKFKSSGHAPPREAKKSNTQPLSRTLNLARCTQRKAPSSSHQPVCMTLNLEVSNKAPALPIEPWRLVVCCLWEILCNRGLVRCFWLLRKCADISAGCWIRHAYVRRVLT